MLIRPAGAQTSNLAAYDQWAPAQFQTELLAPANRLRGDPEENLALTRGCHDGNNGKDGHRCQQCRQEIEILSLVYASQSGVIEVIGWISQAVAGA